MKAPIIFNVDQVTGLIKQALYSFPQLQDISVRGELQSFKRHSSGHLYFTILGKNSRISCVMFRSQAASVLAWPNDGDEIFVRGHVDVYGGYGSYQLYATSLLPIGEGAKARAKEMLRQKLTAEGLFDKATKRKFPLFPSKVAVITSITGAALQDVIRISSKRFPSAELLVVPSLMQGSDAASEIVAAFAKCAVRRDLSAIMLVRGGGNRDDLDTFDREEVVRAVKSANVPVITGLGHQIDSTLCDLAADAEAPTPSGAVEAIFPDAAEILYDLLDARYKMIDRIENNIRSMADFLTNTRNRMLFSIEKGVISPSDERLKNLYSLLNIKIRHIADQANKELCAIAMQLNNASPLAIMSKGYAMCFDSTGTSVTSVDKVKANDLLQVRLLDGVLKTTVDETLKKAINISENKKRTKK